MALSTWITAMVFVEPAINVKLTPFGLLPQIWIGLLSIVTFLLTLVQMLADWRGRAQGHHRSCEIYAEVKSGCRLLATQGHQITGEEYQRLQAKYDLAGQVGTFVPEREFLRQKQRHYLKVTMSTYLDDHPGVWLWWLRVALFLRDNCNIDLLKTHEAQEPKAKKSGHSLREGGSRGK
jgi:hypothetical protein